MESHAESDHPCWRVTRLHDQTWRWPSELEAGTVFDGSVVATVSTIDLTIFRNYRVVGRETVHVPAGDFETWRVESEDTSLTNRTPVRGTYWVAEHVGLVRTEQAMMGSDRLTAELLSWTDGP